MERRTDEQLMRVSSVALHVQRPFRLALFVFSVILSTAGLAQDRRNAVLDTLDARHDKSKPVSERMEIMGQHDEALFAQGRHAERQANAMEYMELAQHVGTDSVLAKAYGMIAGLERNGSRASTALATGSAGTT